MRPYANSHMRCDERRLMLFLMMRRYPDRVVKLSKGFTS